MCVLHALTIIHPLKYFTIKRAFTSIKTSAGNFILFIRELFTAYLVYMVNETKTERDKICLKYLKCQASWKEYQQ